MMTKTTVIIALLLWCFVASAQDKVEINTFLMHDTFKIEGPAREPGKVSFGMVFLIINAETDAHADQERGSGR